LLVAAEMSAAGTEQAAGRTSGRPGFVEPVPAATIGTSLADDRRLTGRERVARRTGAIWEILRPFAYTASVVPVLAGGALAAVDGRFAAIPFLAALAGAALLHSGTNIGNELYAGRPLAD